MAGLLDDPGTSAFPQSLSPSRSNDFLTCPLMYRLRSIDRIPQEPSVAALRGTLVHRALELLFDLASTERTEVTAIQLMEQAFVEMSAAEPESGALLRADLGIDLLASAADVASAVIRPALPFLTGYFALENPQWLEPYARECKVNVDIADGFTIRGFIDRVDRAPSGDIRIVDYKSGRAPSPRFQDKAMFQMNFYALAWWRMTGVIPKRLQLMYLSSSSVLHYEPTAENLLTTEKQILSIRSAISEAAQVGVFTPTTSKLCDWCSYRALCPAWGGTTPPLPPRSGWNESSTRDGIKP